MAAHPSVLIAASSGQPYIIEAGWVAAQQGRASSSVQLIRDASILIDRQKIVEVRPGPHPADLPRLQLPNHLLLPGLISGHTHVAAGTSTRGIIEGGRSFALPLQLVEQLDDTALDALTAHNLFEIVRGGCTTQIEMSLSLRQAESYRRVATRWGVRGMVGPMIPSIGRLFPIWFRQDDAILMDSEQDTLAEIEATLRFAEQSSHTPNSRIHVMVAPHATDTHTPTTMRAISAAAKALGTGVQIHLSQSIRETSTVQRLWGYTPSAWMARLGLFDGPCLGAHMVGLDWAHDPAILNQHGVVYAHCPSGGGAGGPAQPYPEALGSNVATNIAIDTHSNDMIENIKLAVLYGQARHAALAATSPVPIARPTIADALAGATHVIADSLGRPDLGRIQAGATADLVAIDIASPLIGVGGPPPEPLHHLLYANGQAVSHVIIDGRALIWEGRLTIADATQIQQEGYAVVRHLWEMLEQHGWFTASAH